MVPIYEEGTSKSMYVYNNKCIIPCFETYMFKDDVSKIYSSKDLLLFPVLGCPMQATFWCSCRHLALRLGVNPKPDDSIKIQEESAGQKMHLTNRFWGLMTHRFL